MATSTGLLKSAGTPLPYGRGSDSNLPACLRARLGLGFRRGKLTPMPAKTATQNQMATLLREVREIKAQLDKLLLLVPEESLKEYENSAKIRRAYARGSD